MSNKHKISIGKLSEATKIPIPTLRTWERRYSFPVSERTDGNHRLYDIELIAQLQLVRQALEAGHRARQVVGLSLADLEMMLGVESALPASIVDCGSDPVLEAEDKLFAQWLDDVRALNSKACLGHFRLALSQLGLKAFVVQRIVPFLRLLGCAWEEGEVQVFQEHFGTRLITQFLEEHWQLINSGNTGATIIVTAHPLERHTLGLHLVACMLVMSGYSVVMLGNNTPVEEITACAVQTQAMAIAMTFSITMSMDDSMLFLQALEGHLNQSPRAGDTFLVLGGAGTPHNSEERWLVHPDLSTIGEAIEAYPLNR